MSQHAQLKIDTGLQVCFRDPRSPWQRGSNENTNVPLTSEVILRALRWYLAFPISYRDLQRCPCRGPSCFLAPAGFTHAPLGHGAVEISAVLLQRLADTLRDTA